ncbi:carotenoid cleavage dioxygenase 8 [Perilla frutescens var. hirtella]|nr:carotenoid cleavage dioxygenase 8 [Perilla frutescens var. hirtella]
MHGSTFPIHDQTKRRGLTVRNIGACRPNISRLINEEDADGGKLAAWNSVRQEQCRQMELHVEGEIPLWLNGTYLRNGPGIWHIGDYNFRHLFDGYATLVRLHFASGRLLMSHRQIESEAYKAAKKKNKICYREFSENPKYDNFLTYICDLAKIFCGGGASLTDNANTGVVKLGDGRVVCLTETVKGSIIIDPDSLDTLGRFEYSDNLGGLIHSAHPIVTDNEFWTLLPDLIKPGYLVVRMEAGTNERKVIGRVDCRSGPTPGWVHSFPVTEQYVVVPEMPLRYCAGNLLKAEPTPLFKFEWHPQMKGYMHVMCKASGKIVASVEVPLYVTFHFINAYEEKDEDGRVTGIIVDCCEHNANSTILQKLCLQNLRSFSGEDVLPDARLTWCRRMQRTGTTRVRYPLNPSLCLDRVLQRKTMVLRWRGAKKRIEEMNPEESLRDHAAAQQGPAAARGCSRRRHPTDLCSTLASSSPFCTKEHILHPSSLGKLEI